MWHIAIPLIILLLVLLFPVKFKEGYDDYLNELLKSRGYESAKSIPVVEYNTKTGQWEATDPKYESYAAKLQNLQADFKYNYDVLNPNGPGSVTSKSESTSDDIPPDSKYSDKDKELPFTQISGRTSDTKADTTASSDLDTFFKSPAGSSSTDIEKILKLLAERDALTSGKKTSTTGTTTTGTGTTGTGTTGTGTTGTSSSEKGTGTGTATTDKGATQTSTGTSTNLPISGKDFYSQFKPILQQDIETTVKNEIQKQYADNPILGDDPSEECY